MPGERRKLNGVSTPGLALASFFQKTWARALAQAVVLLALWFALDAWQTRRHLKPSTPAPNFTLVDLDGVPHSLADYRGKKLAVHFWATWCGVCGLEIPSVTSLNSGLSKDEALISIVADSDDPAAVRAFVREHHIDYPVLLGTSEVLHQYGVRAFPTNYYFNRDGSIGSSSQGLSTRVGMSARMALAR